MTDRSKLLALAEKAATAREVEARALIEQAFDACHPRQLPAPGGFIHWNPMWNRLRVLLGVNAFAEAAMMLVPEDLRIGLIQNPDRSYRCALLRVGEDNLDCPDAGAATAPLAIVAAYCLAQAEALA